MCETLDKTTAEERMAEWYNAYASYLLLNFFTFCNGLLSSMYVVLAYNRHEQYTLGDKFLTVFLGLAAFNLVAMIGTGRQSYKRDRQVAQLRAILTNALDSAVIALPQPRQKDLDTRGKLLYRYTKNPASLAIGGAFHFKEN